MPVINLVVDGTFLCWLARFGLICLVGRSQVWLQCVLGLGQPSLQSCAVTVFVPSSLAADSQAQHLSRRPKAAQRPLLKEDEVRRAQDRWVANVSNSRLFVREMHLLCFQWSLRNPVCQKQSGLVSCSCLDQTQGIKCKSCRGLKVFQEPSRGLPRFSCRKTWCGLRDGVISLNKGKVSDQDGRALVSARSAGPASIFEVFGEAWNSYKFSSLVEKPCGGLSNCNF